MLLINEIIPTLTPDNYKLHSEPVALSHKGGMIHGTTKDYYFKWDDLTIKIPKGFVWDGASIPRCVWSLIGGPFGRYAYAALVHDFIYQARCFDRLTCDKIFLHLCEELKVKAWKCRIMYRALRIGGKTAYYVTDERGAVNRLLGEGDRYNFYTRQLKRFTSRGYGAELVGFETEPWSHIPKDDEFQREYILLVKENFNDN